MIKAPQRCTGKRGSPNNTIRLFPGPRQELSAHQRPISTHPEQHRVTSNGAWRVAASSGCGSTSASLGLRAQRVGSYQELGSPDQLHVSMRSNWGGLWGPAASKWGQWDAGASYWTLRVRAQLPEGSTSYTDKFIDIHMSFCMFLLWISMLLCQEGKRMRICWCCLSNQCGWPNIYRNMQCMCALCTCWEHAFSLATGWIWGHGAAAASPSSG